MSSKNLLFIFLLVSCLSSCSWITSRKSLFDDSPEKKNNTTPLATVPKAQYDELSKKYETLLKSSADTNSSGDQMLISSPKTEHLLSELNQVPAKTEPQLAETVDIFDKKGNVRPTTRASVDKTININAVGSNFKNIDVEGQIHKLRKAEKLVRTNRFNEAMDLIKQVENSKVRQVKVRAQFLLAEIMFLKDQFDLAMQLYEEILKKHAFSGIVIKSLGKLIVCAERLKLGEKKEKYYSILHDFFEA